MEKTIGPAAAVPDVKLPGVEAIKLLADLGRQGSEITVHPIDTKGLGAGLPEAVPVGWNRNTQSIVSLRHAIEEFRLRPERRTGTAQMQTLAAFRNLVNRHKDADSAIFVDLNWRAPKLTAVIDYHRQGDVHEPRHLQHRIAYAFPLSDEWKKWVEYNGQPMKQDAFAAFIEDHITEIAGPTAKEQEDYEQLFKTKIADPHEIILLSRGLAVTVESKVSRVVKLQSGEGEMVFEEVHRNGSNEKLTVPGLFMLSLPVFFRGELQRMPVRLRYRVANEAVVWFYEIWRPDVFVTDAVEKARDAVSVDANLPVYEGAPEA